MAESMRTVLVTTLLKACMDRHRKDIGNENREGAAILPKGIAIWKKGKPFSLCPCGREECAQLRWAQLGAYTQELFMRRALLADVWPSPEKSAGGDLAEKEQLPWEVRERLIQRRKALQGTGSKGPGPHCPGPAQKPDWAREREFGDKARGTKGLPRLEADPESKASASFCFEK